MSAKTNLSTDIDVAIIGAGIGGLAAAVALANAGMNVHVFERSPKLGIVGGAIVIREPSVRLFERWNVDAPFFAQAVQVDVIEMRDPQGNAMGIVSADRSNDGLTYSIHRADVHKLLLEAVAAENIHLSKECISVSDGPDCGVVAFGDGTTVRAKVVVGADGIKSVVRRLISNDELVFEKLVVLRGIAPASALPHGLPNDRLYIWGQEPRMMTLLPLSSGREVAMDTIMSRDEPPKDLWTSEVRTDELLEFFAGFDPQLLDMIRAGTVPVRANPVYDREPIKQWSTGRLTLLGDAAHPMAPRMGQGANMAIQDAGALAASLAELGFDVPTPAFARYEQERVAPSTAMQLASRKAGPPSTKDAVRSSP